MRLATCEVITNGVEGQRSPCGNPVTFKAVQTWPHVGITREVLLCDRHAATWGKVYKIEEPA